MTAELAIRNPASPVKGARLRVISLGAGVQSTTVALMAAMGEMGPMPDVAIFADTGEEPKATYKHLDWLRSPGVLPFPVLVRGRGERLGDAQFTDNEARVPWHTATGMRRRQCTKTWKIMVVRRAIREMLGADARTYIAPGRVEEWVGISTDEFARVKPSRVKYIIRRDPLIEQMMSRRDCEAWLRSRDYPVPPKSSCVFCPYRSNRQWSAMRRDDPEGWTRAIEIDHRLRSPEGQQRFHGLVYAHRSCVPLSEVNLELDDPRQINMFVNECEGMCGV